MGSTSWTAIAAKATGSSLVQIQINRRTGVDVFIDGVKQDFEDLSTQEFTRTYYIRPVYVATGRCLFRHVIISRTFTKQFSM